VKFRLLFCLVSCVFLSGILFGCGPDGSHNDQVDAERREQEQKDKKVNERAVGVFYGTLSNIEAKKVFKARLIIEPYTILTTNPSSGRVSRVPTLGGNFALLPEKEGEDETVLGVYTAGDFNPQTSEINLLSTSTANGGVSLFSFSGVINGDLIIGNVTTPYKVGMKFEGRRN
jgi:hypothetical protein